MDKIITRVKIENRGDRDIGVGVGEKKRKEKQ